jgi:hypothetical protein
MKAILTKYLPATNTRGSRIQASAEGGNRISIPYPHELREGEETHRAAANALCAKMGWDGAETLVGGGTETGYAFVFTSAETRLESLARRTRALAISL